MLGKCVILSMWRQNMVITGVVVDKKRFLIETFKACALKTSKQVWLPIRQLHNTIPSSQTGWPLSPSQTRPLGTRSCLWAKSSNTANKEGKERCFVPSPETSGHLMGLNEVHFKCTSASEGSCWLCVGTFIMWKHEESGIHHCHDLILDLIQVSSWKPNTQKDLRRTITVQSCWEQVQ